MQHLEVSGAVRPIYGSLGVKRSKYYVSEAGPTAVLRWKSTSWVP